jgi:hypothetical protein
MFILSCLRIICALFDIVSDEYGCSVFGFATKKCDEFDLCVDMK